MLEIDNITNENFQRHTVLFEETQIVLHLKFYSMLQKWFFDVEYKDFKLFGKHLSVGTPHLITSNQPFDFIVVDLSRKGLDPFKSDDFSRHRTSLLLLEPADMAEIRGARVPL